jgi:hypothetical protein
MTDLKVRQLEAGFTKKIAFWCLWDSVDYTFLSDGRRVRTYTSEDAARGALSRVNRGLLADKRK